MNDDKKDYDEDNDDRDEADEEDAERVVRGSNFDSLRHKTPHELIEVTQYRVSSQYPRYRVVLTHDIQHVRCQSHCLSKIVH